MREIRSLMSYALSKLRVPQKLLKDGNAIVTKEQMKKKGFDNLRDYLNAERNLKRRDNFASEAQKRLFATGARGTQTEGSAGEAEARAVAEMRRKAEMPGSKRGAWRPWMLRATSHFIGGMKKGAARLSPS
jgi:hypothetical protein